jgi:DedD protein
MVLAWIFFAGILAGRGMFPDVVKVLTPSKGENGPAAKQEEAAKPPVEPPLAFYRELPKSEDSQAQPQSDKPANAAPPQADVPSDESLYCVQVASLESESKAEQMTKRLRNRGYSAFVSKTQHQGKELFRVRCGLFATQGEAERLKGVLIQKEKLQGFVVKADGGA